MSEAFKAFEAAGWDAAAATYGSLTGRATAHAFEPLLDLARVGAGAGARVLDVGCGPGGLTAAAASRGAEATGLDLSEEMVAAARAAHPELRFEVGDAEEPPFGRRSFDCVVGAFVLNHVPEPWCAGWELAELLAPGGRAAFAVWDRPERARLTSLLADATQRAGFDRASGVPEGPSGAELADPEQLTLLLLSCGLGEVETHSIDIVVAVESLDALWQGLLGGTVRSAAAVRAAGAGGGARVRAALADVAAEFADGDGGYAVPSVIRLGAGERPS